ncbi:MAG: helix-turn-helix transcriptional regulator [Herbinix sp.]|nr:helix-turn-helix transcriptional regulator [Herbinix sp.]
MLKSTRNPDILGTGDRCLGNVVNVKAIRKSNLPYIFIWIVYYAWVIVFTTWWTASPVTENVISSGLRSMLHSINLLSSAFFVLIIRKEWFVKTARVGAILIITGMGLFMMTSNTSLQLSSLTVFGITLGIVNISILIPFVFVMNNTEKFYSVLCSNVLINLIMFIDIIYFEDKLTGYGVYIFSFSILVTALLATIFFKKSSLVNYSGELIDAPEITPRIYLTLLNNCAVAILCKGIGKGILNITAQNHADVHLWYYVGGLIGCILYFILNAMYRRAYIWLNNITFSTIAMGLICNAFIDDIPQMLTVFAILMGIGGTIGMINMYYILAVVGKKYNSMRYVKLSIFLIGLCGGISGVVIGRVISSIDTVQFSIIASIVTTAFLLIFLILSPSLVKAQQYNDWVKDAGRSEIDNRQKDLFAGYRLSRREIEVCKLLLEGYTLRQISGVLSIAYSTVNTYCTAVYRKLTINSRAELIILFKDYIKD